MLLHLGLLLHLGPNVITFRTFITLQQGVLIVFLGVGVLRSPENPYPISNQNIWFSIHYFRPDSQNVYPISDAVMGGKFGNCQ